MVLAPVSLFVAFSGSDGKVAAHSVQLCCRAVDAVYLWLRHLHRLPPDLGSVLILLVAEFLCFVLLSAQLRWWRALNDSAVGSGT